VDGTKAKLYCQTNKCFGSFQLATIALVLYLRCKSRRRCIIRPFLNSGRDSDLRFIQRSIVQVGTQFPAFLWGRQRAPSKIVFLSDDYSPGEVEL
jgi:hypothetical protein